MLERTSIYLAFCCVWLSFTDASADHTTPVTAPTAAVEKALSAHMEVLAKGLANPMILSELKQANQRNAALSDDQIKGLDERWAAAQGVDDFVKPYLTNPGGKALLEFQDENDGFVEIFITDTRGLNVSQTNKTSDLYQADEEWWTKTWNNGQGHSHHGEIEYDESARTEAIAIYLPITEPGQSQLIGVAKAVIDITGIKRKL